MQHIAFLLLLLALVGFYDFYVIFILVDLISVGYWSFCIIAMISHTHLKHLLKDFREKIMIIQRFGDGEK